MLTLNDLKLVRYVAASGSLTETARQMHVSQSAVSQRLTKLHARMGVTLIERRDGLMRLTPAGHRILTASTVIADELNSALIDIKKFAQQESNQLRITTQCCSYSRLVIKTCHRRGAYAHQTDEK